ncbi:hypothetical protein AgCh_019998 [Apium graveolens]
MGGSSKKNEVKSKATTAQLSGGSIMSENFTTGKNSRIKAAETQEYSSTVEVSGRVDQETSGSRKSERPRVRRRMEMNLRSRPRSVRVWIRSFGKNRSV